MEKAWSKALGHEMLVGQCEDAGPCKWREMDINKSNTQLPCF